MNVGVFAGAVLFAGGLAAYAAGIAVAYPGRSLSITAIMIGVTLMAVLRGTAAEEPASGAE